MASSREEYVESVKKENIELLENNRAVIRYKRNGKGERVGTILAYVKDGKFYLGASKCRKGDKFDRHLGIYHARKNSEGVSVSTLTHSKNVPPTLLANVPLSMKEQVIDVVGYLKQKGFVRRDDV